MHNYVAIRTTEGSIIETPHSSMVSGRSKFYRGADKSLA